MVNLELSGMESWKGQDRSVFSSAEDTIKLCRLAFSVQRSLLVCAAKLQIMNMDWELVKLSKRSF